LANNSVSINAMNKKLIPASLRLVAVAVAMLVTLFSMATPAFAHRLDEYLEAATISVTRGRVQLRLRLVAGVVAAPKVLALIDANGDNVLSDPEQRAYAERVRRDLSLAIDGRAVALTLVSKSFASVGEIHEGLGDIILTYEANTPAEDASHRLTFENHHQTAIATFLVNTIVPDDSAIHILAQDRTRNQSSYQLDFAVGSAIAVASEFPTSTFGRDDDLALVTTYFWHGVHHILTGFDHLLFLAALVLGAASLWELVKVVTAFTIAHSVTLTMAALGLVHLSGRVVEPLIAASIVFVAVQNIFWPDQSHGRSRLAVAFFFGLFHGLGFAGGLLDIMHQMPHSMVLLAILGFSIGVETGNQIVLLLLFGLLKALRGSRARMPRGRVPLIVQRIGSAAVSLAGVYYLGLALIGAS
jgi:hydrogenase/urease accessory protein HupE